MLIAKIRLPLKIGDHGFIRRNSYYPARKRGLHRSYAAIGQIQPIQVITDVVVEYTSAIWVKEAAVIQETAVFRPVKRLWCFFLTQPSGMPLANWCPSSPRILRRDFELDIEEPRLIAK